jgi:ribose 5-phosphate isomerase B
VVCLGERLVGPEMAWEIVQTFLATEHMGGRHAERVAMLHRLDGHQPSAPIA